RVAEVFLDTQQLVVFRDPIRARQRPGLDLQRVHAYGNVGYRRVLGLPRPVRNHGGVTRALRELDRRESLSEVPDLVHLDEDRVCDAELDSLAPDLGVGDEDVVT